MCTMQLLEFQQLLSSQLCDRFISEQVVPHEIVLCDALPTIGMEKVDLYVLELDNRALEIGVQIFSEFATSLPQRNISYHIDIKYVPENRAYIIKFSYFRNL